MRSIFFDLDGTLIDISEKYYQIYADFMISNRLHTMDKKHFWRLKRSKAPLEEILGNSRILAAYQDFFISHIEHPKYLKFDHLIPFSINVVRELSTKGLKEYGVSLRQDPQALMKQIKNFKLDQFAKVLTAAPPPFQSSENYRLKIKLLKPLVSHGDIIVGDSRADILAGKALKLTTVAVLSGISNYKILKTYNPDYIFRDIRSLTSLKG